MLNRDQVEGRLWNDALGGYGLNGAQRLNGWNGFEPISGFTDKAHR
jgi:hypothetical protein